MEIVKLPETAIKRVVGINTTIDTYTKQMNGFLEGVGIGMGLNLSEYIFDLPSMSFIPKPKKEK